MSKPDADRTAPPSETGYLIDFKGKGQLFLGHSLRTSPPSDSFTNGKGKLVAHIKPNLIHCCPR